MNKIKLFALVLITFSLISCGEENSLENNGKELHISAAISLSDVLEEVKQLFETEYGVKLTYQFGGSGKLAQQLEQGAPGDVFISANDEWMDSLIEKGIVSEETYTPITKNQLVLVGEKGISIQHITDLTSTSIKQIAIGHPDSVPAGHYAQSALLNSGIWTDMEEKMILTQDVRQVLTYVETGNAEVGFVYESDALSSKELSVLTYIDPSLYESIIYPGAVRADSNQLELGVKFLQFLQSDRVQEVFIKHGFSKLNDGDLNGPD